MGDDSANFQKLFAIRIDNRLHYVSLTSNVKLAHKRKEGTRLCNKRLYEKDLVVE